MTIYNLGSINADLFYQVDHLALPGETLTARDHSRGLGGKGANQSVAAARAGSRVVHIGAVGSDGVWATDLLQGFGVNISGISVSEHPTGHAIIAVDRGGENNIILWPGANRQQDDASIARKLSAINSADTLLLQNETNAQGLAAKIAHDKGARVIYSAAPFSVETVRAILPLISILIVNEVEASQLSSALDTDIHDIAVPAILKTKGADGAVFYDLKAGSETSLASPKVDAVDTTGAGDTFAGYFAAGLDQGQDIIQAMKFAAAAAALKVTRRGTAQAIPTAEEVTIFLDKQPIS